VDKINVYNRSYLDTSSLKSDETVQQWKIGTYGAQASLSHRAVNVEEKPAISPAAKVDINPLSTVQSSSSIMTGDPRVKRYFAMQNIISWLNLDCAPNLGRPLNVGKHAFLSSRYSQVLKTLCNCYAGDIRWL